MKSDDIRTALNHPRSRWAKQGQRLIFYPELLALTAISRQLSNEALGIYYAESTFYFADTMLQPSNINAFKALQGNLMNHIQSVKAQHRLQIRDHNVPRAYQKDTFCNVSFAAYLSEGKLMVNDVQVNAVDRHYNLTWAPTVRAELWLRFLKDLVSRAAKSQPGSGNTMIQFLTDYVQGVHELSLQSNFTCRACRSRRTIQLPGACCGYMDEEMVPFFCDRMLAVKRGEAFI